MISLPLADLSWALPLAASDALGLAALGALFFAFIFELRGRGKGKVFSDKLAQQLSSVGARTMLLYLVLGGFGCWLATSGLVTPPWRGNAIPEWSWAALGCASASALFSLAYAAKWRWWRDRKGAHLAVGWLMVLACLGFLATLLAAGLSVLTPSGVRLPGELFPRDKLMLLWAFLMNAAALAAALGPAVGAVYLLLRRSRDDFGRDYYVFGLRSLASVGAAGAVISPALLAATAWLAYSGRLGLGHGPALMLLPEIYGCWAAAVGLLLVAAVLLFRVRAAEIPQRCKASILLAVLCMGLACLGAGAGATPLLLAG